MSRSRLQESRNLFVRRWGEMSAYWGITRTMAEIHALLFISNQPLSTDDIMTALAISRGNASMNLRSLVDWGLIERVHERGQRREFFRAIPNVWHMFETITRQRQRREVEPILETIRRCRDLVSDESARRGESAAEIREYRERLDDMLAVLTAIGKIVDLMLRLGPNGLRRLNATLLRLVP